MGRVLIMNNVHIGNYGVKESDVESDHVKVKGVIGRNLEEQFSRFKQQILCRHILNNNR
jgi:carbamoyl-phosphate synthase small subunit